MPSKKVLSVFILAAAVVAAAIIAFGRDKASSAIDYTHNLLAGDKVAVPENPDWQSELPGSVGEIQDQPAGSSTPETMTEAISRNLMANYLAMKQNGSLTAESAQKLIDQTLSYMGTYAETVPVPKLNVVPDDGKRSITAYGEKLGTIARAKKPSDMQKETEVIIQILQSGDESKLTELESTIQSYKKIEAELVKMPVPKTFVKAHTDITRGTMGIALALTEIKNLSKDPLRSVWALGLYQESAATLMQALSATVSFISQSNVVYEQGSGGYYLLHGL